MFNKGIILAGGQGTRLFPMTKVVSKQLLPVYDKPMIYYPLSTLMLAGIQDILIISSPESLPLIQQLFGDGKKWGLRFSYVEQKNPEGIAQAFLLAEDFIDNDPVALILGDNIFYGNDLSVALQKIAEDVGKNTIFGYKVKDPENFGIAPLDENDALTNLVEKPKATASNWAVPGLDFYGGDVVSVAKTITPSARGELEITDVNRCLLEQGNLDISLLGRGTAWLDCGTPEALLEASEFIKVIEKRAGLKISCPEEIAFRSGFINKKEFSALVDEYRDSEYGCYLASILDEL